MLARGAVFIYLFFGIMAGQKILIDCAEAAVRAVG